MTVVAVRGRYVAADGSSAVGQVTFTPRVAAANDGGERVLLVGRRVSAILDGTGAFTVGLQATDDPDLDPVDWTYQVVESIKLLPTRSYDISVPVAAVGAGIDLVDVAPAVPSDGEPTTFVTLTALAGLTARVEVLEADAAGDVNSVDGRTGAVSLADRYDALGAAAAAQAAAIAASQPLDADLTAISGLATTAYGRALLALADAAAGQSALGLGSAATQASSAFAAASLATQVPTLEELETRTLLPTAISATSTVYLGPTNFDQRVGALTLSFTGAIAASDANFWTVELKRIRANGTAVTLATLSTKATGGAAIAALTGWSFDNVVWPSILRHLCKGDVLALTFTKTGTPANLADGCAAVRYEPNVTPLVHDSFTRANANVLGTADSGQAWTVFNTVPAVAFGIVGNQAATQSTGTVRAQAGINAGVADCSVSAVLLNPATSGIAVRQSQAANGTHLNGYIHNATQLFRCDADALTALTTFSQTLVAGDTVTITCSGSAFTVYRNGVQIGAATDSVYLTQTTHGLRASNPVAGTPLWDDFGIAV